MGHVSTPLTLQRPVPWPPPQISCYLVLHSTDSGVASMSESLGLSPFAIRLTRNLQSFFSKVIGLESAVVLGLSVLGMHTTIPCFCCSMIRPFKYIWLNRASRSFLILTHLTLKSPKHLLTLLLSLLQTPLLTAAFSSSSVMVVFRKSFHPNGKVICSAFYTRVTRIIHVNRFIFALHELHKDVQNAPSGRLCYTFLVDNDTNHPRHTPFPHLQGNGKGGLKYNSLMCIYGY